MGWEKLGDHDGDYEGSRGVTEYAFRMRRGERRWEVWEEAPYLYCAE